jgi:hypothetical protein
VLVQSHTNWREFNSSLGQTGERDLQMTHGLIYLSISLTNERKRSFDPCDTQNADSRTRRRRKAARRVNASHADCAECESRILNCLVASTREKHLLASPLYILIQTTRARHFFYFFVGLFLRLMLTFYLASNERDLDLIKVRARRHRGSLHYLVNR